MRPQIGNRTRLDIAALSNIVFRSFYHQTTQTPGKSVMKHAKALDLIDHLQETRRLVTLLVPLLDEGREQSDEFLGSLDSILSDVFPTYTVAVTVARPSPPEFCVKLYFHA